MEATIKAIHFDVSEKLVNFINKKIDKISRRYEGVSAASVTLKVVKPETAMNKEVQVRLTIPTAADLFATKTADTFEEGVDQCLAALEPGLEKLKGKA